MRIRLGRAHLTFVPLVALLAVACSGSSDSQTPLPDLDRLTTIAFESTEGPPGRLLVLGLDDEIFTIRPDGSGRVTLAEPDEGIERTQPTWSPDGRRVAWTESRDEQGNFLVVADRDGANKEEWPSPLLAVYIAWSPGGEHLALTGSPDGIGDLLLAVAGPDGDIQVIDQGAPVYFDWAPDGTKLLARVSGRFEYLAIDGSRETVPATGEFRLGAHVAESVMLGTERDVGEALALATREGEIERELLRYAAPMAFVADGTGSRVAVMSRGSPESQALSRLEETDLPIIDAERLMVVTTSTGHLEEVSPSRNIAWFWSPHGHALLYSTVTVVDGTERLQWHTWDGDLTKSFAPFSPTGLFARDYLAYFDQFALSISLWAPDGSAFAYAGGNSLEDAGIWVQEVSDDVPELVSPGQVAIWSPVS